MRLDPGRYSKGCSTSGKANTGNVVPARCPGTVVLRYLQQGSAVDDPVHRQRPDRAGLMPNRVRVHARDQPARKDPGLDDGISAAVTPHARAGILRGHTGTGQEIWLFASNRRPGRHQKLLTSLPVACDAMQGLSRSRARKQPAGTAPAFPLPIDRAPGRISQTLPPSNWLPARP